MRVSAATRAAAESSNIALARDLLAHPTASLNPRVFVSVLRACALGRQTTVFGEGLVETADLLSGAGQFEGEGAHVIRLPVCSVLRVDGYAADMLKHAVNAVTVGVPLSIPLPRAAPSSSSSSSSASTYPPPTSKLPPSFHVCEMAHHAHTRWRACTQVWLVHMQAPSWVFLTVPPHVACIPHTPHARGRR